MAVVRVLLLDGQAAVAEAVAARVSAEPDLSVVAIAGTLARAVEAVGRQPVDIVLVGADLALPAPQAVVAELLAHHPELRVLVVIQDGDSAAAFDAMRAGAAGCVTTREPVADVLQALRRIHEGQTWIAPQVAASVLDEAAAAPQRAIAQRLELLTPRERAVLGCLVRGMDAAEVGQELFMSRNTVRAHRQRILEKLGVHSTLEAVSVARRAGIER